MDYFYYRPQTKFAKVMFLQVSVILSRGGACVVARGRGGVCGCSGGAYVVARGVHGCSGGVVRGCSRGGMHGFIWGHAWFYLGGHAWFYLGGCVWFYSGGVWFYLEGHAWFYLGGCVWFYSGGVWFYLGGVHGFIWDGHAWFFQFFRIQWDTVNEWAVRILLECILVFMSESIFMNVYLFNWICLKLELEFIEITIKFWSISVFLG